MATASNATSRLAILSEGRLGLDASAQPVIVTQPASISTVAGGTAAMFVGVEGTSPFRFQWYFNDSPMPGQTNFVATLNPVIPGLAGSYQVIVRSDFGAVTSVVATLSVDAPNAATILSRPYGDTVPLGATLISALLPPVFCR